jgi:hypothetical protein
MILLANSWLNLFLAARLDALDKLSRFHLWPRAANSTARAGLRVALQNQVVIAPHLTKSPQVFDFHVGVVNLPLQFLYQTRCRQKL